MATKEARGILPGQARATSNQVTNDMNCHDMRCDCDESFIRLSCYIEAEEKEKESTTEILR